jgi:tetratricopeptide (TPR) repeat protein
MALARRLDDPELLCRALNARYRYVAALGPDRWPDLDLIGEEQLAVATAAGLTAYQTQAHHILGMARLGRNDLDRAQWHLDRAVEHATSGQLGLALGILGMFNGLRELVAGRFDQAERAYAPVIAHLKDIGSPSADDMQLLVEFCIEHARGGPGTRQRMAALAERARPAYERLGEAVAETYARVLIGAGEIERARAVWRPEVAVKRDYYWFRWTTLRAENALHLGDLDVAAVCYRQLLPWAGRLPGLLHAHVALGPVDHTLGELAAALGRPAVAARHFTDAIAVAERIGAPHWATRSRNALRGHLARV